MRDARRPDCHAVSAPAYSHSFAEMPVHASAAPLENAALVDVEEPPATFDADGNELPGPEVEAPEATEEPEAETPEPAEELAQAPAAPAAATLVIVGPREMWFFDGATPPSYPVSATLRTNLRGGTFAWSTSSQLSLSSPTDARPTVTSSAPSASLRDAWIRVRHTPRGGTTQAASYRLTVRAPQSLTPTGNVSSAIPRGWQTLVGYSIQDQFGTTLPNAVEVNELWDDKPAIGDFAGTNWPSFPPSTPSGEGHAPVSPAGWNDVMNISDGIPPVRVPTPGAPGTGGPLVMHFRGHWQVGSPTIGGGRRVRDLTWRFFQDHGDHA